jgi:hypothetical protein
MQLEQTIHQCGEIPESLETADRATILMAADKVTCKFSVEKTRSCFDFLPKSSCCDTSLMGASSPFLSTFPFYPSYCICEPASFLLGCGV